MRSTSDKLILLAKIVGAFGLAGEVRIRMFTEKPENILGFSSLVDADGKKYVVKSLRSVKTGHAAHLQGVEYRDKAQSLKGVELYAPRSSFPETGEEEYYQVDLIGLRSTDVKGEHVGHVKAVHNFGAGDILEIEDDQTSSSFFLPFDREHVPRIELQSGIVIIKEKP